MPIESVQTPRAPSDWRPSSDQRAAIQRDPRLQGMSRDEQYFYFNKPKPTATPKPQQQAPQPRAAAQPQSAGVWGWVDSVLQALRGTR
jgi:hypothetical protein